ncbi:winged helix-turn-helix transcriptional regulator [Pseudomonas sp. NPDC086251]|uniref:winged helix-turn-helix transcriptional regulator n=1 Tax=Pseudomonas sp. NPDC086251 TaxID=3364431 RepID=UPI0038350CD8
MAKQPSLEISECPVARAMETIGERWSLLIIRDALDDIRRFSDFHKSLGLAKNILSSRLKLLVEIGVFEVHPAADGGAYKEYMLTERGRSVFPIVVALRQWGEQHLFEPGEVHSVLLDKAYGEPVTLIDVRSAHGSVLRPEDCYRRREVKQQPNERAL